MNVDLYPEKAQYISNEKVYLIADISQDVNNLYEASIQIYYLSNMVKEERVKLKPGKNKIEIGRFDSIFAGYGAQISIFGTEEESLTAYTAFDVVSDPGKSIRYGFLSDFSEKDGDMEDVDNLRKLHINMVQFYDWSYRHDELVAPKNSYTDMMDKEIDLEIIRKKITFLKKYGMKPMAYGAVYAASKDFYNKHEDWAFYTGNDEVFKFIDTFYIMNIAKECPWHEHIIKQYKEAVEKVGFSGIHMDTYGFPKTAFSKYEGQSKLIKLGEEFATLINDTKESLDEIDEDTYLIFNNVGNWPVEPVGQSKQAAIYVEVWNPYERYFHIKQIIQDARKASNNKKPVILAAYLAPFRLEELDKAGYAAYILTAAIVSNGGYHLLLGEENAVLTQGYYSDYSKLDSLQSEILRKYYDFMIRYMNLFHDTTMRDVSMTHMGWDNYEYQCNFDNWSSYGEANKIWLTLRENDFYKSISMINLCGCKDDLWNKGKDKPVIQKGMQFTVFVDKNIKGIYYASPDQKDSKSYSIDFRYVNTDKGKFVQFDVPDLVIWSLIYIEL
ncbi:cycloisomaltooligosaccharide glucanotransferase precursor [Clostridium puniceum]|uniref:Cycloisomaltooligosaccharide glucanotransferase n=1 Tax=Clostridium puniceum TaxID=29367 RepID=A0A1S8T869_9CLOT|nr:glycoside hydrolase family 66 protein [Clostridium puniceum]OOM73814.1 cycloisomaltooligosaccharide glucanotransferase precursor [Clostridium puniceum]